MSALLPPSSNPCLQRSPSKRGVASATRALVLVGWTFFFACGPAPWPGGIHAMLAWSSARVRILSVPAGSAAERAGLAPDDVLLAIDGVSVAGLSREQVQERLRGEVGVPVRLRIARGTEELELLVPRTPYQRAERR